MELAMIEIKHLRKEFNEIKNLLVTAKEGSSKLHNSLSMGSEGDEVNSTETTRNATPPANLNVSVASIEEFIVDPNYIPSATSINHLNSQDPTIQL